MMATAYDKWVNKMSKGNKTLWFGALVISFLFIGGAIGTQLSIQRVAPAEDEVLAGEKVNVISIDGRQVQFQKVLDDIVVLEDDTVLYNVNGEWYEKGRYTLEVV